MPNKQNNQATKIKRKSKVSRASRKSPATRKKILNAAAELFAERGYGQTKMVEVAKAVDMHVTALYYYFNNKEALATAVLSKVSDDAAIMLENVKDKCAKEKNIRLKFAIAIEAYLQGILRSDVYGLARKRIGQHLPPDALAHTRKTTQAQSQMWRKFFEEAQHAGEIRSNVNITFARMILIGALNWSIEWFEEGPEDIESLAANIVSVVFDGISI